MKDKIKQIKSNLFFRITYGVFAILGVIFTYYLILIAFDFQYEKYVWRSFPCPEEYTDSPEDIERRVTDLVIFRNFYLDFNPDLSKVELFKHRQRFLIYKDCEHRPKDVQKSIDFMRNYYKTIENRPKFEDFPTDYRHVTRKIYKVPEDTRDYLMLVFAGNYYLSEKDCGDKRCIVINDIEEKTSKLLDIEINYSIDFRHDSALIIVDPVDSPERPWIEEEIDNYIPERHYAWDEEEKVFYQLKN